MSTDLRERVHDVVEDLATDGSSGFHASFVAEEAHVDVDATREILVQLARGGKLEIHQELVCPSCGRTLEVFDEKQSLPLGATLPCTRTDDPPFIVSDRDIIVSYAPTKEFIQQSLRQPSGQLKKKALQRPMTLWRRLRNKA